MFKLKGKKTYIGIAVMVVGFTGLAQFITPDEIETVTNAVIAIAGVVTAVYGRYDATRNT